MIIISDLHIHSRFSRATSKSINIQNLEKWAKIKGLGLLGTGDFSHPEWFNELKKNLKEEDGILRTDSGFPFILSNEISLVYNEGKVRRIHLILLSPSFDVSEQITDYLKKKGRVDYDGRPIFNIPCYELTENLMSISEEIEIIPAHAWTPWFGIFGSVTGFDSIEEAFKDKSHFIHSFETGMSSDPAMNWRLSKLDKYSIVSFSDAHSFWPWRIGREATAFDLKNLTYRNVIKAIRENEIAFTIETSPAYGKYHYDGHRLCKFSCSPQETRKLGGICPICKRTLTIGVENRIEQLADREEGFKRHNAKEFFTLLPLAELISLNTNTPLEGKVVMDKYNKIVTKHSEFDILLNLQREELIKIADEKLVKLILLNRKGKIKVKPGYDGEYGVAILEEQTKLF